jgi:hypothetical protein
MATIAFDTIVGGVKILKDCGQINPNFDGTQNNF